MYACSIFFPPELYLLSVRWNRVGLFLGPPVQAQKRYGWQTQEGNKQNHISF